MTPKFWTRAALAAAFLIVPVLTGCGGDSESKIVRDAHPDVPPLAPGSTDGMNSRQVDPGAAGSPSVGTP